MFSKKANCRAETTSILILAVCEIQISKIKNKFIEIKNDKDGNLSFSIGRKSFQDSKLLENLKNAFEFLKKEKPAIFNSENIKKVYLTSTMGASFKLNFKDI